MKTNLAISEMPKLPLSGTLSEQVRATLRRAIVDGTLVPGEIYSVSSLSEQLGVSRTPAREAVLQLARIGLMEVLKNQGVRVLAPSKEDFVHIMQLRLWIEVPATHLATGMANEADHIRIQGTHDHLLQAASGGDSVEAIKFDRLFHRQILEVTGNMRMVDHIQDLRDLVIDRGQLRASDPANLMGVVHEHDPILEGFITGDAVSASEAMRRHLESTLAGVLSGPALSSQTAGGSRATRGSQTTQATARPAAKD